MKRCPRCGRVYDDAKNFCLDDGESLGAGDASAHPAAPPPASASASASPETSNIRATPTRPVGWSQSGAWEPPPRQPKRRVWPWVVGAAALFILGTVALLGIIAYVGFKAVREGDRRSRVERPQRPAVPPPPPVSSVPKPPAAHSSSKPPTDRGAVLEQLKEIEEEWARANREGDKEAVALILADEYVGTSHDGKTERKADYIASLSPSTEIVSPEEFEDLKLVLGGARAILTGVMVVEFEGGRTGRYRFVDIFVWRDGRWQAVASTSTEVK